MVDSMQRCCVIGEEKRRQAVNTVLLEFQPHFCSTKLRECPCVLIKHTHTKSSGVKSAFKSCFTLCPADTWVCFSIIIY
jgi:hypothetical protein